MREQNLGQHSYRKTMLLIFGFLILLRMALSSRLPSYILSNMPHDDGWLVSRAQSVLRGEWLGSYDQFALIKGPFSPLLLAFSNYAGVTFSGMNSALYCFACVVFILSVRPIIKNYWMQLMLFCILLFNPITYALQTGQRIYRNGIGQWEIMLIFACLIAVFLRRNRKSSDLLRWVLLAGVSLGIFSLTREDGAWIYPFILGSIGITVSAFLFEKGWDSKKIMIFLLPIAIAIFLKLGAAFVNYAYYGAPIVNDRSGGNFAKVAGWDSSGLLFDLASSISHSLFAEIQKVLRGERSSLPIFGNDWNTPDGTCIRDYLHISDLVIGHINALKLGSDCVQINLGLGRGCSVLEVISEYERVTGLPVATVIAGRRHGDVGISFAETTRAEQLIDWRPLKTLSDMCLDSYRASKLGLTTPGPFV